MKSTWVAAGLLLLTICQAAKKDPDEQSLLIKSLTAIAGEPTSLRLCFSGRCGTEDQIVLIIYADDAETSHEGKAVTGDENNCCSTHKNIPNIYKKEIGMELFLHDTTPFIGGSANLTVPDLADFPSCDPPEFLTNFNTIRLPCDNKGHLTKLHFLINDDSTSPNCDSYSEGVSDPYTKYCLLNDAVTGNLAICDELPNTSLEVADEPTILVCLPAEDISLTTTTDVKIGTETVDYDSNKITLTLSSLNEDKYEMVSKSDDQKTAPPETGLSNTIAAYDHIQGIDYLLLNLDEHTKAHHGNIPGYDLEINALSVHTLEVNWINDETSNPYHLACKDDTDAVIRKVDVSCGKDTHCYGYFMFDSSIPDSKVEVSPSNKPQTIRRAYHPTPGSTTEAIEVRGVQLQRSDERQITEAEICFQHQTTEPQAYEVVIINSQGEWRRGEGIVTLTSRGVSCIKPMVVLETEFLPENQEITVIVLQRDEDSRKVLASGEAKINANISY